MGSQQIRAINLVHSLASKHYQNWENSPEPKEAYERWSPRILVVGGGAGGLTAAAFAAFRGAKKVTLVEKEDQLMPHLDGSDRLLHPRLYEWGSPRPLKTDETDRYWNGDQLGIPLLDWEARNASDVRKRILKEWKGWEQLYPVETKKDTGSVAGDDWSNFDCVILAVGFGEERKIKNLPDWVCSKAGSYWEHDHLHRRTGSILICGNGDSALTDLFKACLRGFDQDELPLLRKKIDSDRHVLIRP